MSLESKWLPRLQVGVRVAVVVQGSEKGAVGIDEEGARLALELLCSNEVHQGRIISRFAHRLLFVLFRSFGNWHRRDEQADYRPSHE